MLQDPRRIRLAWCGAWQVGHATLNISTRWSEKGAGEVRIGMSEYLVTVHTDDALRRYLLQPMVLVAENGLTIIPKDCIACDACGERVAYTESQVKEGISIGYALFVDGTLYEVLCEKCKQRYYPRLPVYRTVRRL